MPDLHVNERMITFKADQLASRGERTMRYDETFTTPEQALAFAGDLRNLTRWDPSIEAVEKRIEGEIGLGARFMVRLRFLGRPNEIEYERSERSGRASIQPVSTSLRA